MNPKLSLIARQVNRREQRAPVPEASSVGSAIEQMIQQAVNERVEAALAEQRRQLEGWRRLEACEVRFDALPFFFEAGALGFLGCVSRWLYRIEVNMETAARDDILLFGRTALATAL